MGDLGRKVKGLSWPLIRNSSTNVTIAPSSIKKVPYDHTKSCKKVHFYHTNECCRIIASSSRSPL